MSDSRKTLGVRLSLSKRRRDSDPSVERSTRRRVDEPVRHCSDGDTSSSPQGKQPTSSPPRDVAVSSREADSGIGPSGGLTLPGFRYLGPGNPLDNGRPTNEVDEVAREHDLRYSQAELLFENSGNSEAAFNAIQEADSVFLNDLSEVEPQSYTETFGKFIGQAGIGAKKTIEGLLHSTLYPRFHSDMDVDTIDGGPVTKSNAVTVPFAPASGILSVNEGVNHPQKINWHFKKHFNMSLVCKPIECKKTEANASLKNGTTEIKAYIHSLPWQMLYFYMTEREYNTIINTFHSAYVERVTIKIYNMGVTSEAIQSSSTSFKTLSTNHYLGIWKNFERYGPVALGTEINPAFLYGTKIADLNASTTSKALAKSEFGAITELKRVDNRVTYSKVTSSWENNKNVNNEESNILPPQLIEMATIIANASTSSGLIYKTTYEPKDSLFHNRSSAFHNIAVVQHKPYEQNIDIANNGAISDATYKITTNVKENDPAVKYEHATVDNMFFKSLRASNPLDFIHGLGIGLFPKRQKDDTVPETTLDIYVQTEIAIKGEAFGGSVLFQGNASGPQCNPNRIFFIHSNKKFGNAYASDGLPTMDNVT